MEEIGIKFFTRLFNGLLMGEWMPKEWRRIVLILIYKTKEDAQYCGNYQEIKLMSHTIKIWERIIEARLRDSVEISKQIYSRKGNYRCYVCFKNVDGKVHGRSKRGLLCIRGPRESLRQVSARSDVVLYEKIRNSGKAFATCTGYVPRKQNSGEVCSRNYKKFQRLRLDWTRYQC